MHGVKSNPKGSQKYNSLITLDAFNLLAAESFLKKMVCIYDDGLTLGRKKACTLDLASLIQQMMRLF